MELHVVRPVSCGKYSFLLLGGALCVSLSIDSAILVRYRRISAWRKRLENGGAGGVGTEHIPGTRFRLGLKPPLNLEFFVETPICSSSAGQEFSFTGVIPGRCLIKLNPSAA